MTAPVNSYLKALLALSEDKTLESSRRSLLQSLSDADLQRVVQHGVGREFARGALKDIAITILDVIVRDPQSNYDDDATKDGSVKVKKEPGDDKDNIIVLAPPERRITKVRGAAVKKTQARDGKKTRVTEAKKIRTTDVRKTRATVKKTEDPDVKETQDPDVQEIQNPDVKKARVPFVIKTEPDSPIKTQSEEPVKTQLDSQLDLQLESHPDTQVDSQPNSRPEPQADSQPDTRVDSQFDTQSNLQPDEQSDSQLNQQLNFQPDPQVDLQQDLQLNSQPDPQLDSQLNSQSDFRLDPQLDSQFDTQPDLHLHSQSDLHLDPQLESQPNLQLDPQLDPTLNSRSDFVYHSPYGPPPTDGPQSFQPHMLDPEVLRPRKRDGVRCSSVSLDLESVRQRAKNSPAPLSGAHPRFKLPHILVPINCNEVNQTIAAELVELLYTDTILQEIQSTHSLTIAPAALELLAAIPMIIWFPKESVDYRTVQNITGRPAPPTELPTFFHAAICASFTSDYLSTDEHRERYKEMLANQDAIMTTETCVNNYVVLRSDKPSPRRMSGQDQEGACDECIKNKRVCVRFVRVRQQTQLAVFPLPVARRAKKQWTDLACWIQE
ncbi:hypothetical protein A1F94_010123 [Pyrenophora tritici-repentis]|uniref:Uncharacterized protein n=1 Tax=Pyrenophora tritici-repentis TaxID=45151 RepID=A0A922NRI2_9PLEO|nr:hypothetical protein A1F99_121030 [Pyrenophora tritici-repentis]KAG9379767.1 hypothetical protein A1F94_010123 [Pyrenophora tritici-repentis]KAI0580504.1 hypothetical protein Alg130_07042 [Pyrenophora tritici-repentis]KAI0621571.1 hypothetical protein TUN199_06449 [Pyrenophora tritici-repentis]KAI1519196.1 hypothetical protein Ptr86124_002324 [Pyrenophora tritici-repentis]